jgi:hypothetical protein
VASSCEVHRNFSLRERQEIYFPSGRPSTSKEGLCFISDSAVEYREVKSWFVGELDRELRFSRCWKLVVEARG